METRIVRPVEPAVDNPRLRWGEAPFWMTVQPFRNQPDDGRLVEVEYGVPHRIDVSDEIAGLPLDELRVIDFDNERLDDLWRNSLDFRLLPPSDAFYRCSAPGIDRWVESLLLTLEDQDPAVYRVADRLVDDWPGTLDDLVAVAWSIAHELDGDREEADELKEILCEAARFELPVEGGSPARAPIVVDLYSWFIEETTDPVTLRHRALADHLRPTWTGGPVSLWLTVAAVDTR